VGHRYVAVQWNRQKRIYDAVIAGGVAGYLGLFSAAELALHPNVTAETTLIRALGTCALLMLHVILSIGPLARLDRRFLPLLYNRRHLGVTTFLVAAAHGIFSIVQFHALSDRNPLVSVLVSDGSFGSGLAAYPFQPFGAAATSGSPT
jgi:sulfoxide reductase heme-binding subunit YedZ